MNALAAAHKGGGWVLLQNVHLTIDWTSGPLEKRVDKLAEGAHPEFRWAQGWGVLGAGAHGRRQ
jgi:dynein heavy chain